MRSSESLKVVIRLTCLFFGGSELWFKVFTNGYKFLLETAEGYIPPCSSLTAAEVVCELGARIADRVQQKEACGATGLEAFGRYKATRGDFAVYLYGTVVKEIQREVKLNAAWPTSSRECRQDALDGVAENRHDLRHDVECRDLLQCLPCLLCALARSFLESPMDTVPQRCQQLGVSRRQYYRLLEELQARFPCVR